MPLVNGLKSDITAESSCRFFHCVLLRHECIMSIRLRENFIVEVKSPNLAFLHAFQAL